MGSIEGASSERVRKTFDGSSPPIPGVLHRNLQEVPAAGGPVLHMIRADDPVFTTFGEVYFSVVEPGSVKAWKRHLRQTQLFAVPWGLVDIVLYDDREESPARGRAQSYLLGRPGHYSLLRIPPLVWYGFAAHGPGTAILANCVDLPHDSHESERLPVDSPNIPFAWGNAPVD